MQDSKKVLLNLSIDTQKENFIFKRLYRLLYNENLYKTVLKKINIELTPELETKIKELIKALRDEKFKPTENSLEEILVQEVLSLILNTIYEPVFSDNLHSNRQLQSCHTALKQIQKPLNEPDYFITGTIDIYSQINFHILIDILRKKIKDERFIRLIWKFLKKDWHNKWEINKTYSGCLIGTNLYSVLVNIYLNEFDQFIDNQLKSSEIVNYIRYSSEYFIEFKGSKENCKRLIEELQQFLVNSLKLKVESSDFSIECSNKPVKFLGYEVVKTKTSPKEKANWKIKLKMPKEIKKDFLKNEGIIKDISSRPWKVQTKKELINLSDYKILSIFNSKIIKLYRYYHLAENVSPQMNIISYPVEKCILKTLALKHKSSVGKIKDKYRIGKNWGIKNKDKVVFFYKGFKHRNFVCNDNKIDLKP